MLPGRVRFPSTVMLALFSQVETQEDPSELFAINISEGRAPIPVGRLDVLHLALLRVLMHPLSEDFSPTYTLILDGFAAGQGVESMGIRNWFFKRHEAVRPRSSPAVHRILCWSHHWNHGTPDTLRVVSWDKAMVPVWQ